MPYDKRIPHVMIPLSERSFDVLSKWASVGRSIDVAVFNLTRYQHVEPNPDKAQDAEFAALTLLDLKNALDECNASCKMVRMDKLYAERKQDKEVGERVKDIDAAISKIKPDAEPLTLQQLQEARDTYDRMIKDRLSKDS